MWARKRKWESLTVGSAGKAIIRRQDFIIGINATATHINGVRSFFCGYSHGDCNIHFLFS